LFNHQPGAPFEPGPDYNWELVYQLGTFAQNYINAWTVATETGFTFPVRFTPRISLRADVASGGQHPNGGTLNTFNPLFPRGAYFGPKFATFGPYNFFDVHPGLMVAPFQNVMCAFDLAWFWRESLDDGIYQIGGALLRPSGGSRARYIGSQPNFDLLWALDLHTTVEIVLAGFLTGGFLKDHWTGGQHGICECRSYLQVLNSKAFKILELQPLPIAIEGDDERSFFRSTDSLANLKVEELPMPVPKEGEGLVKVLAAAINPSDVKNILGKMAETKPPRVPGRDFAGLVVAGDTQWLGKSVFGTGGDLGFGRDGSHAEFMAVPVEALVEKPPALSEENAAASALTHLTAFAAIARTGQVKSGETVLVTGTTGAVGSAAASGMDRSRIPSSAGIGEGINRRQGSRPHTRRCWGTAISAVS
jgi:hypothetical protein